MLKIWRSPYSRFGIHVEYPDDLQDETVTAEKSYTDEVLKNIMDCGFNAIWIHGQLHHIIPNPHFPEFAPHGRIHLNALRSLCLRAAKYGIRVFVYLQPPRAIPTSDLAFWQKHIDIGGQVLNCRGDDNTRFDTRALCTSTPYVRDYLRESFADFTRLLPELGGFIIISASEYPAHCYANRNCRPGPRRPRKLIMDQVPTNCPRCGARNPEDVVAELLNTVRDGVRSISSKMELIFWNWSWTMYADPPCETIISRLPQDITLMVDFERGGIRPDGIRVDEYSLGYAGPSEQFLEVRKAAERHGITVMPKYQLGTTHELATVRTLPVIPNLFRKADYLRSTGLHGFMGCWNFGNLNSSSLKAFNFFLELKRETDCDEAMTAFAHSEYPGCNAEKIIAAWHIFADALAMDYPFCVPFLYDSPVNHSLALIPEPGPLSGKPVGRSWLPDERGDVYPEPAEFPLEKLIRRLGTLAEHWKAGVELLREALGTAHPDFINAAICGLVWQSSFNLYQIYRLRKNWNDALLPEYRILEKSELAIAEEALPLVAADTEQGWHIEGNFHSFSPELIEKKIAVLKERHSTGYPAPAELRNH